MVMSDRPHAAKPQAIDLQPRGALGSCVKANTLGVMGGGQLGRMWVHAAQAMGFTTVVLEPDAGSPAGAVSHVHLQAAYDDAQALRMLANTCLAVSTEFENVPAPSLDTLAQGCFVAPGAHAVRICQDRALEKAHFVSQGVPCAPHASISTAADLLVVDASLFPAILKTAQMGYDGRGQVLVADASVLPSAWRSLGGVSCLLEKQLSLTFEVSVIVARGWEGAMVHLPVQQNLHRQGILAVTQVPAPDLPLVLADQAVQCAQQLAAGMGYVGVLCVEFFVLNDGSLVANEMAPRPHNSGHYSLDACDQSQFALQLRAMARLPLVAPRLHSAAVMLNLLGELWPLQSDGQRAAPDWAPLLALPGVHLHLYGKHEARAGRKMGHLTVTAATPQAARATALQAAALLGMAPF